MRAWQFLTEKEILLMGGNAFKNLELRRIKREEIPATLKDIAKILVKAALSGKGSKKSNESRQLIDGGTGVSEMINF